MLNILQLVEAELPKLLLEPLNTWNDLLIDYHPPVVHRIWRQWGDFRIAFHNIDPCDTDEALFHPHPWPSAMRILIGKYEMGVGYSEGAASIVAARLILPQGATYEMVERDAWHYVRPLEPSFTLMVTGKPFPNPNEHVEKATKPLSGLSPEMKKALWRLAQKHYILDVG